MQSHRKYKIAVEKHEAMCYLSILSIGYIFLLVFILDQQHLFKNQGKVSKKLAKPKVKCRQQQQKSSVSYDDMLWYCDRLQREGIITLVSLKHFGFYRLIVAYKPSTIAILQTILSTQSVDHKLVMLILGSREQLLTWRLCCSEGAMITARVLKIFCSCLVGNFHRENFKK